MPIHGENRDRTETWNIRAVSNKKNRRGLKDRCSWKVYDCDVPECVHVCVTALMSPCYQGTRYRLVSVVSHIGSSATSGKALSLSHSLCTHTCTINVGEYISSYTHQLCVHFEDLI